MCLQWGGVCNVVDQPWEGTAERGRRSRILVVAVLTGALLVPATHAAAEDTSHHEYSVLYAGNYSAADAHRFSYRLYGYGPAGTWYGVTQTAYDTAPKDVMHWDVTNGYPGVDPSPGANQRDILYLSETPRV